jgi:anti-sigma factor RsiW
MNGPDDTRRRAPLDCEAVSLRLSDWLEGDLADSEGREIGRHLEQCARCARERAELESLGRLFERDATPAPGVVAEARLKLRRALVHERGAAGEGGVLLRASAAKRRRILWLKIGEAAGFLLLLALFVPIVPRMNGAFAPAAANGVVATLAHEASNLVASAGSWLPALPEWRLPAAPPESLRAWFGALHSDAR